MNYTELENSIKSAVERASDSSCHALGNYVIERIRELSRDYIFDELTCDEKKLLDRVFSSVFEASEFDTQSLKELDERMTSDEIRAIEFNPIITQLTCALDNYSNYESSGDRVFIYEAALNLINCADYNSSDPSYSHDSILSDLNLNREYRSMIGILESNDKDPQSDLH